MTQASLTINPERLSQRLPAPPGEWTRTDDGGGIVEYRIAGTDGVCASAKLTVRPDIFSEHAVRVDRKQGCKNAGTTRFENVRTAVETVETELHEAERNE